MPENHMDNICDNLHPPSHLPVAWQESHHRFLLALHERERSIKAARGKIVDRNGIVLADNRSVCTVSVIHSQIRDPERVIAELAELLELPEDTVRKRVEKVSSFERISSNVPGKNRITGAGGGGVPADQRLETG